MVYYAAVMKVNRAILPPGRIGLAVSGGADSVALAFLLTKGCLLYTSPSPRDS